MRGGACLAGALALGLAAPAGAQEMPLAPRSDFGSVVASERQLSGGDLILEQAIGGFDSEPAYTIAERSIYRRLGRAVGRLDVLTDKGTGYCTAWIVSERYLVTNHHCVPGNGSLAIQSVQFVAGYVETGVRDGTAIFNVSTEPVEADKDLDYAVLEVFGNPAKDWGTLDISAIEMTSETHGGVPLLIIGHPIRLALHFSRKECRAALRNAVAGGKLRHTCDTLQGNSGSPVLSEDTRSVVALHHAGSASEGVNFAIPMSAIVEHSSVLRGIVEAAAPAPSPTPTPTPAPAQTDPCDDARAHFDLARDIGTKGAYEAHLAIYGDCVYAGFARNALDRLVADVKPVPVPAPPEPEPEPEPVRTVEDRAGDWIVQLHAGAGAGERLGRFFHSQVVIYGELAPRDQAAGLFAASFEDSATGTGEIVPETLRAVCTEIYCRVTYEASMTVPGAGSFRDAYTASLLREGDGFAITELFAGW